MKKFMLRVMPIVLVALVVFGSSVFALDVNTTFNNRGDASSSAVNMVNRVWGIVLTVLQVLAVAAIVFAGVRYMFAGADQKAEIKSGLLVLAIGAILVFGASTVVRALLQVTNEVTRQ
mgnify:CR=1 FL=1